MPSRRALCALFLEGLAAVAAPSWAQPSAGDGAYTIQRGDTLSGIARRLGVSTEAIQQANDLTHPDRLSAGRVLRLPTAVRTPVAAPPAALATPEAAAPTPDGGAIDTDQSAVGACKHPTLGALRVSKGPDGILLDKDSKNIPMRRLLYAIYDGTDATGNVHNVELVFDDAGHVVALRYSNGGTGPITFDKMEK